MKAEKRAEKQVGCCGGRNVLKKAPLILAGWVCSLGLRPWLWLGGGLGTQMLYLQNHHQTRPAGGSVGLSWSLAGGSLGQMR